MALQLLKDFTVVGGAYVNTISMSTPLTITQDGGVDDINAIAPTYFYVYNDGKRRDPLFDPVDGTTMNLRYEQIVLRPKSFSTVVISAGAGSNGTSSRLYLGAVSVSQPANMKIEIGSVLTLTQGTNNEDVLVMKIGGDSYGSYVDVIRNYRNSSTTLSALNIVPGNSVTVSTKHIFLSKTTDFSSSIGGSAVTLNDVTSAINTPNVNPDVSLYQTIYIRLYLNYRKQVLHRLLVFLHNIRLMFILKSLTENCLTN
jgi:hypothetical protein